MASLPCLFFLGLILFLIKIVSAWLLAALRMVFESISLLSHSGGHTVGGRNKLVSLVGGVQELIFGSASKQNEPINSMSSSPSTDGILIEVGAHGDCLHFCVEFMVVSKRVEGFRCF